MGRGDWRRWGLGMIPYFTSEHATYEMRIPLEQHFNAHTQSSSLLLRALNALHAIHANLAKPCICIIINRQTLPKGVSHPERPSTVMHDPRIDSRKRRPAPPVARYFRDPPRITASDVIGSSFRA